LQWTFRHIKGHQDNILEFEDLDRFAQLNVYTDHIAKQKLSSIIQTHNWHNRHPQHLPYKPIEIYWIDRYSKRTKICSQLQKLLTNKIHLPQSENTGSKNPNFHFTLNHTSTGMPPKKQIGTDKSNGNNGSVNG
jgi:hypothetical protein